MLLEFHRYNAGVSGDVFMRNAIENNTPNLTYSFGKET